MQITLNIKHKKGDPEYLGTAFLFISYDLFISKSALLQGSQRLV